MKPNLQFPDSHPKDWVSKIYYLIGLGSSAFTFLKFASDNIGLIPLVLASVVLSQGILIYNLLKEKKELKAQNTELEKNLKSQKRRVQIQNKKYSKLI